MLERSTIKIKFASCAWNYYLETIQYIIFQTTSHCLNKCWHNSSTHRYVSRRDRVEYYATLWSYNNRNGYIVEVAALVVPGGAEASLQRLRWWLGRSSWRHIRVIDKIAMHSYLPYTVFKDGGQGDHPGDMYGSVIISLSYSYLLYTVLWEHHSYRGFMCLFILIIVLINIIFYLCVWNAFISYYCIFLYLYIYVLKVGD